MRSDWRVGPEADSDVDDVRAVTVAAFPSPEEADIIDRLRADADAWIDGLSYVAVRSGRVIGHALLTRCQIVDDGSTYAALALGPCSVLPEAQRTGVGTAVITQLLAAARNRFDCAVVVLGHAEYYPRFGFEPASRVGVRAPFDVPDEAFMVLSLGGDTPAGTVSYPQAFGV